MVRPTTRPSKTVEDYLALPDDIRAELIAGELYMSPAPSMDHQRAVGLLFRRLAEECDRTQLGEALVSPIDVHLPTGDVVQPDLIVVARAQAAMCRRDGIHGAPRLLIEVLSPGNAERDRIVKRRLYAECGVAEYWILEPAGRSVEVFVLEEGSFQPRGWFTEAARIVSPLLPDLDFPVHRIFP